MEIWQLLPLFEGHDFFSNAKLQENAPFTVRNYLNIFNTTDEINPNNIKETFFKLMDEYSFGKIKATKVSISKII